MYQKVIRTLTYFVPERVAGWSSIMGRIEALYGRLITAGYEVQTLRLCSPHLVCGELPRLGEGLPMLLCSWGTLRRDATDFGARVAAWRSSDEALFFNMNMEEEPTAWEIDFLFETLAERPLKLFHFAYTVSAADNRSPFFPSAHSEAAGFAVGLQSTSLAEGCKNMAEWQARQEEVWAEVKDIFASAEDFLGIDSSVAPLYEGASSLFAHLARWYDKPLARLATGPVFGEITRHIKTRNPMPTGLCGLMLPCLEDFELARLYDAGEFSTERNLFLSLHSGLGIDTYPFGVDEDRGRMLEILRLLYALGRKYSKPLSVRWISDGRARIGERSDFGNQFLLDAVVRGL